MPPPQNCSFVLSRGKPSCSAAACSMLQANWSRGRLTGCPPCHVASGKTTTSRVPAGGPSMLCWPTSSPSRTTVPLSCSMPAISSKNGVAAFASVRQSLGSSTPLLRSCSNAGIGGAPGFSLSWATASTACLPAASQRLTSARQRPKSLLSPSLVAAAKPIAAVRSASWTQCARSSASTWLASAAAGASLSWATDRRSAAT
mmetsp:Transcript_30264/g.96718  ORF Transcript_30264/g.96718 Transcript_30264/m.96718 type:complete len:201 (+) Transcript_30264:1403-2005(+)